MKNNIILILILCLSTVGYAQRKYIADTYFDNFAYKKSAELYEKIQTKSNTNNYLIISRLADSYYFNSETDKAAYWYKKLIENFGKKVKEEHFLRYAQVLRSNRKYKDSDAIIEEKFNDIFGNVEPANSLINRDYISSFTDNFNKKHIKIHNEAINTPYSDFGGFIHNSNFYFSSAAPKNKRWAKKYKWNNQPYLNLYAANIADSLFNIDATSIQIEVLKNKRAFSRKINTKRHEASMTITKDGKTMYFTRASYSKQRSLKKQESVAMLKIYKATLINNEWKNITKLPFNNSKYSVGHPALSPDEKTLYFISDMKGGYGSTDIYKVDIYENNSFGKPKNLGSKVNTRGREMFPFIGAKNMLYFSSDGYKGLGGLDIYEVQIEKNDDIKGVRNLKAPFNSNLDDFAFVVDTNIKKGFFSSNRAGGKGDDDIYSFSIDKSSILKALESIENSVEPILQDSINTLKPVVIANSAGENDQQTKEPIDDLIITDNKIVTNPIYFDFDSYSIKKDVVSELDKVVEVLKKNPEMVIKIESHTDSRGSKVYNKILSDKRAKSTRNYIVSKGIAIDRIESAIGYGEEKLLYECATNSDTKCTEEIHRKNRRSYFYLVKNPEKEIAINTNEKKQISHKQTNGFVVEDDSLINENQIVTKPICFDFNRYSIREDAKNALEKVIKVMQDNPEMVIKIESHTDSRGSKAYNKILSDKRAKSTQNYLVSKGIAMHRIESAIGYGEEKLLNGCDDVNYKRCSNDQHELNRRSYFYIVKNKQSMVSSVR